MKKLIDCIIEKLYVKRFPERCDKFPLPDIIRVNIQRYSPITLSAEIYIHPYEAYKMDMIPKEWIRKELSIKLAQGIVDQIKIEQALDPQLQTYIYRGSIKILKEDA